MSRIEKLLQKFRKTPESVKSQELENILLHLGCEKILAKGSHVKFKHQKLKYDIVIPVHNNDCKSFYKKQALKQLDRLIKTS